MRQLEPPVFGPRQSRRGFVHNVQIAKLELKPDRRASHEKMPGDSLAGHVRIPRIAFGGHPPITPATSGMISNRSWSFAGPRQTDEVSAAPTVIQTARSSEGMLVFIKVTSSGRRSKLSRIPDQFEFILHCHNRGRATTRFCQRSQLREHRVDAQCPHPMSSFPSSAAFDAQRRLRVAAHGENPDHPLLRRGFQWIRVDDGNGGQSCLRTLTC